MIDLATERAERAIEHYKRLLAGSLTDSERVGCSWNWNKTSR